MVIKIDKSIATVLGEWVIYVSSLAQCLIQQFKDI